MAIVRITINLPLDLKQEIDNIKNELGFSTYSAVIIEAIKNYKKMLRMKRWENAAKASNDDLVYQSLLEEDFLITK